MNVVIILRLDGNCRDNSNETLHGNFSSLFALPVQLLEGMHERDSWNYFKLNSFVIDETDNENTKEVEELDEEKALEVYSVQTFHKLSEEGKIRIFWAESAELSCREVGRQLGGNASTISRFCQHYAETNSFDWKKTSDWKRKMTESDDLVIRLLVKRHRFCTMKDIQSSLNSCVPTLFLGA